MKKRFQVFFFAFLVIGVQSAFAMDDGEAANFVIQGNDERSSLGWDKGFPQQKGVPFAQAFRLTQASFKFVSASSNTQQAVADCGVGFIAIAGGSRCDNGTGNDRLQNSCPCTSATCTSCASVGPTQFWLTDCDDNNTTSYATCVPIF